MYLAEHAKANYCGRLTVGSMGLVMGVSSGRRRLNVRCKEKDAPEIALKQRH